MRAARRGGVPDKTGLSDERGSTLLLTIFYGMLSLALILLVVAATSLYLERKRLFTLADGAALVGAEAFEIEDVEVGPGGPHVTLQSADVASAVTQYVARNGPGSLESVAVVHAGSEDGRSATVTLSAYWRPPVLSMLVPEGFRIEVTAVARSVFS